MSPRSILTLANGRGIDLRAPRAADIDFDAYAEQLAKESRYNGATPGEVYSVAQHLALGVDAILAATAGDELLAAEFSLHDAPEAVLRDDTTLKKHAIAEEAAERFGILAEQILQAFDAVTERHDAAVHEAAGLHWPMTAELAAGVKYWDNVMFVTEWRDLMRGAPHPNWGPYLRYAPLCDRINPWKWETAKIALMNRWRKLLPALRPPTPSNVVQLAHGKTFREQGGSSQ